MAEANIPDAPFLDGLSNRISQSWYRWLLYPSVNGINIGTTLTPTQGGTGLSATPGVGQILIGDGANYTLAVTLPASAFPALSGDITTVAGALATTLATVNGTPGTFGTATAVSAFTVNGKGLITAASNTNITGSAGAFTAVGAFGCNGKAAQTSATVNAAIGGVAGAAYTAVEQTMLNDLRALVNQIRTALINDGIAV